MKKIESIQIFPPKGFPLMKLIYVLCMINILLRCRKCNKTVFIIDFRGELSQIFEKVQYILEILPSLDIQTILQHIKSSEEPIVKMPVEFV